MRKKTQAAVAAAGIMLVTGCDNGPPEFAEIPSDPQMEAIEADLERVDLETPFVKRLLDRADPIPQLSGSDSDNNDHVKEMMDELVSDGYWYFENDRYVIAAEADVNPEDLTEMAPGMETKKITDNYVVIIVPDGYEFSDVRRPTNLYMQQFARHHYSDSIFVGDGKWEQIDLVVGEVMSRFYGIDSCLHRMDFVEQLESDVRRLHEDWEEFGDVEAEELQDQTERLYAEISELSDTSDAEWIELSVDEAWPAFLSENYKELKGIGITEDEYRDALSESDELFNIDRERLVELMQELRETYPEYSYEVRQEQNQEASGERNRSSRR